MPTTKLRHSRGFTLIEAMMASIILSFCVAALASAMTAATQQSVASNAQLAALNAARSGMETLAAYPLAAMYLAGGPSTQSIDESIFGTQSGVSTAADVSFASRSASQGSYDLAVVKVTVTSAQGPAVTLYRLVTKEGNGQ